MARSYAQHCGLARALDRVGERWTLLIVRELLVGPARYTDLRSGLPGMATNLLADRLKALEDQGIVARRPLPPPAATTVYELTDLGRGLEEAVHALLRWGGNFMADGARTDAFRPRWLAVALRAVAQVDAGAAPLLCGLVIDGEAFTLTSAEGVVEISTQPAPAPDLVLVADGRAMLGIAAGQLSVDEAVASGRARVDGEPAALSAFSSLWRGAPV